MGVAEDAAVRFAELGEQGHKLAAHPPSPTGRSNHLPELTYYEWRTESLIALRSKLPANSPELNSFDQETNGANVPSAMRGVAILRALSRTAANGELYSRMTDRIRASVFISFLDMADQIRQDPSYYQGGALLAGAVLEDALRQLCQRKDVDYKSKDMIDVLNKKLLTAEVYGEDWHKRIDLWRDFRNAAAHAEWERIKRQDVEEMVTGVNRFLIEYLS